jgi:hypothetical protein
MVYGFQPIRFILIRSGRYSRGCASLPDPSTGRLLEKVRVLRSRKTPKMLYPAINNLHSAGNFFTCSNSFASNFFGLDNHLGGNVHNHGMSPYFYRNYCNCCYLCGISNQNKSVQRIGTTRPRFRGSCSRVFSVSCMDERHNFLVWKLRLLHYDGIWRHLQRQGEWENSALVQNLSANQQ